MILKSLLIRISLHMTKSSGT